MKKLMVAVSMIAATVSLNAASIDWEIGAESFMMSDNSTYPENTMVYVLDTGASAYTTLISGLAAGTLGGNLAAAMTSEAFTGSLVGTGKTFPNGEEGMEEILPFSYAAAEGTATVGTAGKDYYLAILVTDGEKYLVSDSVSGTSYAVSPDDGQKAAFSDTDFQGGWATYTAAVPEPTSGLLLLLGVAGMALRRRRV